MSVITTQRIPEHAVDHTRRLTLLMHRPEAVMLAVAVEQHPRRSKSTRSSLKAEGRIRLLVESR